MLNNPSPLAYPSYGKNSNYQSNFTPAPVNVGGNNLWNMQNQNNVSPQEVELMMKQKFNQYPFQAQQNYTNQQEISDPYTELQQVISSCSSGVKYKIINDKDYVECDNECENLLKQAIEEVMIPQLLNTPQGRNSFEKFVAVTKKLKNKYSEEEMKTNQQLQALMQDEVVRNRLIELSGNKTFTKEQGQENLKLQKVGSGEEEVVG